MSEELSLWGLFFSALLSSTLLPGGSEVILAALAANQATDRWLLVAVASLGNTLGGMSSWLVGRLIAMRYPANSIAKPERQRAVARVRRYGSPILLLSWLPVVGDPLCVAAGWLKISWGMALLFISIGKILRYIIVVVLVP